jgi:ferrous iron transport protein A
MEAMSMPLSTIQIGQSVVIKSIDFNIKLRRRLQDMGLTPGVKLNVVSRSLLGPLVVDVRGTRVALGKGIATNIQVAEALV